MISERMILAISNIHRCIASKQTDLVKQLIYEIANDVEEVGEDLLKDEVLPQNKAGADYIDFLKWYIEACSYVEEELAIPAVISDEMYDKLIERLADVGGFQQIGSPTSNIVGMTDRAHKFPELRGSLAKVHFLWEKDVPEKDTRRSLEWYLGNIVRQMNAAGLSIGKTVVSVDIKYDGVSHIIEGVNNSFVHVLTRGDVTNNMGKDLTPLFNRFFPDNLDDETDMSLCTDEMIASMNLSMIPADIWDYGEEFGIKVETYMPTDMFDEFKKTLDVKRCNRRSAVTSICNQTPSNIPRETRKYDPNSLSRFLRMQHFQISTYHKMELDGRENDWVFVGKLNGRYQYLYTDGPSCEIDLRNISSCVTELSGEINAVKEIARVMNIPCDGAVITFLDQSIVNLLGRKDNKNMFQVAFKFPAGEEITTVEGVDFQVGPIAGRITPVVRLKPIVINGNTISNVTASNADKLNRLHLHIGDEVLIRYDIIPSIFKTDNCKETDGELIEFPEACPICGGKIVNEVCSNYDCPAKTVGHVLNFVDRVKIKGGIGVETIELLVEKGFIKGIGDLYRLMYYKKELCELPRLGETSVENILSGISAARQLYPHQVLGSIGIPNIGLKTMEKICRRINLIGNLDYLNETMVPMCKISGIGEKTASMVISGIQRKKDVIEDICRNIELKPYEPEPTYTAHVCFTSVEAGDDFKRFLETKGVKEHDSLTKSVEFLIIPDEPLPKESVKMKNAKKWGIPMITLSDAKERWGYDNK